MSLRLNRISEAVILKNIAYEEASLAKLLSEAEGSRVRSNAWRYSNAIYRSSFDLAMAYYQQERSTAEILDKLSLSAEFASKSLILRGTDAGETWEPTGYEKALALVLCFGDSTSLSSLLQVRDSQISQLHNPQSQDLHLSSLLYCKILQRYIPGQDLDPALSARARVSAARPNTWRYDQIIVTNKLRAIEAVSLNDSASFNQAMQVLVEDHKNESMSGDLQKLPDANIAISLLMLSKLALDKAGLATTVQSVYLPLHLLQ